MSASLNPLTLPRSGTHLIEASAGTGKTWNIAALYTRLVLLEQMSVDKILVVTFSKAATAELKTRLRARLDEALAALQQTPQALCHVKTLREHSTDGFLFRLLVRALQKEMAALSFRQPEFEHNAQILAEKAQNRLQLRLKAAISDFDHAAIFTLHGFCQRVLQDFAFYCQVPFRIQLQEDDGQSQHTLAAAQDFWRQSVVHDETAARLVYDPQGKITPMTQLADLDKFLSRPYLQWRAPERVDLPAAHTALRRAWCDIRPRLPEIETAFWALHPSLNGNVYRKETFAKRFDELKQLAQSDDTPSAEAVWQALNKRGKHQDTEGDYLPFNADIMLANKRKNAVWLPEWADKAAQFDDVYRAAGEVLQAQKQAWVALNHAFLNALRQSHEARKKEQPERRFDDLLLDVFYALQEDAPHAEVLAQVMSDNWQTALIDEFQDTDPLQYEVFRRAFGLAAEREAGKALFLVGDPKQAIYGFRGADIFAYLAAADDAPTSQRYTLTTNHRSHEQLINSISAFFAREQPFALPEIDYPPANAARETSRLLPKRAAVAVRWLNEADGETAEILGQRASQWCAQEIVFLLQDKTQKMREKGGERRLKASEIAVLVQARKDGVQVQRALKSLGVQSVLLSQDNVFAEDEAQAIYALMGFLIQPQDTGLLSFALSGSLFDATAEDIQALWQQDTDLLAWMDLAGEAMAVWQQFGIYSALQMIWQRHGVEQNLLAKGGERALTNIHQLMELLAHEAQETGNPLALHQWFGAQIQAAQAGKTGSNAALLRLESDENLVKIVTMHASKGLQYPIVFCPYAFKARPDGARDEWHIIHQKDTTELVHCTQMTDADRSQQQRERLSEDLRLLYVALTRAEEQLTLYMGQYSASQNNPFAYLLNWDGQQPFQAAWQQFIAAQPLEKTDFEFSTGLVLPPVSGSLNAHQSSVEYRAKSYARRFYRFLQHTSFTGLMRQTQRAQDEAAREELSPSLDAAEQFVHTDAPLAGHSGSLNITDFPAGTQAGVCLHEILEHFRPAQHAERQQQNIARILQKYGFDAQIWGEAVHQNAMNTFHTPLLPHISLATLPESERIDEMGFVFHSEDFSLNKLKQWFRQEHLGLSPRIVQAAQTLNFRDIHGFISGFIDVFAYTERGESLIIDYKSNDLGKHVHDYHQAALDDAMADHHYYLQALIYAIAGARYLKSRHVLPKHISVRYLFLRGLDGILGHGVWQWDILWEDLQPWL